MERVGVVGCGLMGSGIAEIVARSGSSVVVIERNTDALNLGRDRIEKSLARAVSSGKLPDDEANRARANPVSYTHLDVYKRQMIHSAAVGPLIHVAASKIENTVKTAKPNVYIRTRPKMSPTRPRLTTRTEVTRRNPIKIHRKYGSFCDARGFRWIPRKMLGRADVYKRQGSDRVLAA